MTCTCNQGCTARNGDDAGNAKMTGYVVSVLIQARLLDYWISRDLALKKRANLDAPCASRVATTLPGELFPSTAFRLGVGISGVEQRALQRSATIRINALGHFASGACNHYLLGDVWLAARHPHLESEQEAGRQKKKSSFDRHLPLDSHEVSACTIAIDKSLPCTPNFGFSLKSKITLLSPSAQLRSGGAKVICTKMLSSWTQAYRAPKR